MIFEGDFVRAKDNPKHYGTVVCVIGTYDPDAQLIIFSTKSGQVAYHSSRVIKTTEEELSLEEL